MRITMICVGFLIAIWGVNISEAAEVRYMPFMYEDTMTVPVHADMFVACDNCPPRVPLTQQPKQTVSAQKPALAMMFSKDPEKPLESASTKKQGTTQESIGSVLFAFDSYTVSGAEKKKLNDIAALLTGKKASVKGYTCDIGSENYNMRLSQKRANAVGNILSRTGADVVEAKGMGECCSVSDSEKRLNRRVEIKIVNQ